MKKTITTLVDDLTGENLPDGSKATNFSLDNVNYTIDLSEKNREKLSKALAPFIEVATRAGGRAGKQTGSGSGSGRSKEELGKIREWATAKGLSVSERGRISGEVIDAYEAEH